MKNTNKVNYQDPKTREQIAKQYQPLVYKIAHQQKNNTPLPWQDVLGFAEEGLAKALNDYKDGKGQTFRQYAGYQILYSIQNGINNEGHTVKFSAYMQQKAKENGGSTWIMKSIDMRVDENGEEKCNIKEPSVSPEVNSHLSIMNELYQDLESHFSAKDCDIFYQMYGLKNYDFTKGIDIAKQYKCSAPNVTLICKKIINYIKSNQLLMDELATLL